MINIHNIHPALGHRESGSELSAMARSLLRRNSLEEDHLERLHDRGSQQTRQLGGLVLESRVPEAGGQHSGDMHRGLQILYHLCQCQFSFHQVLGVHTNEVLHVSFCQSGDKFVTCSKDGSFIVWRVRYTLYMMVSIRILTAQG